jgi:hypothetical protein
MKLLEEFVKRIYIVIILEYLVRKLVQGTIKKLYGLCSSPKVWIKTTRFIQEMDVSFDVDTCTKATICMVYSYMDLVIGKPNYVDCEAICIS